MNVQISFGGTGTVQALVCQMAAKYGQVDGNGQVFYKWLGSNWK